MRMKKFHLLIAIALLGLCSCSSLDSIVGNASSMVEDSSSSNNEEKDMPVFTEQYYRGFSMDNVLLSEKLEEIHYNIYVPDDYDGSSAYALYFTLPGYIKDSIALVSVPTLRLRILPSRQWTILMT